MARIEGVAKRFDDLPVDYVSIFNWSDGACIAQITPNASGAWEHEYIYDLNIGITYVSNGCEPITHGSYDFAAWKPLNLFDAGQYGIWFDPSDLTTLFQDAAGAIPVTGDGQPVGLMLDKSGNNYHAVQSSAANRPTYKTSGGKHWIQFDGLKSHMIVAHPIPTDVKERAFFAGIKANDFTKEGSWIANAYGGTRSFLNLSLGAFVYDKYRLLAYYKNKRIEFPYYNFTNKDGAVISAIHTQPNNAKLLSNNNELSSSEFSYTDTDFTVNNGFVIGTSDTLAANRFYSGNMYGIVFILKKLSVVELDEINGYLANKIGLTLA